MFNVQIFLGGAHSVCEYGAFALDIYSPVTVSRKCITYRDENIVISFVNVIKFVMQMQHIFDLWNIQMNECQMWMHYLASALNKQRIKRSIECEFSLSTQEGNGSNAKIRGYCKIVISEKNSRISCNI